MGACLASEKLQAPSTTRLRPYHNHRADNRAGPQWVTEALTSDHPPGIGAVTWPP